MLVFLRLMVCCCDPPPRGFGVLLHTHTNTHIHTRGRTLAHTRPPCPLKTFPVLLDYIAASLVRDRARVCACVSVGICSCD
uniref:Uncharacterized protein n=1 Tax=Anopheles darlingi TaxID=43151 RepID=A0A2M4DG50_ANODA